MFCVSLAALGSASLGAQETLLVRVGDEWRYLKGTAPPPEDWTAEDLDDSDWLAGPTGIGYGDNDDATLLSDMQNSYVSVFTRRAFTVADPGALPNLTLRVTYDDGLVAYLNGSEVGRVNMPEGPVSETTTALGAIEPTPTSLAVAPDLLKAGTNVLAVSVHNAALTSSDLSFIPELVVNADLCPKTVACSFTPGAGVTLRWTNLALYDSISIRRNGEVLEPGLDGTLTSYVDADPPEGEVVYGVGAVEGGRTCAPLECALIAFGPEDVLIAAGDDWRFFRGSSPFPPGWNLEPFDDSAWERGPTGIGYGDGDDATVLDDMQTRADDPATPEDEFLPGYAAILARREVVLPSLDGIEGLVLSIVYDDGFVAFLNGQEIGRANMPPDVATEATFALAATEPGAPLQIPIPASFARAGRNVLAVGVHNASLTSSDLSFIPILASVSGTGGGESFQRGNADATGVVNITDAVFILRSLFQGGEPPRCPDAADLDDDGRINITDAVILLRFLFQGGERPPPPGAACGADPTPDGLGPCAASGC